MYMIEYNMLINNMLISKNIYNSMSKESDTKVVGRRFKPHPDH